MMQRLGVCHLDDLDLVPGMQPVLGPQVRRQDSARRSRTRFLHAAPCTVARWSGAVAAERAKPRGVAAVRGAASSLVDVPCPW